MLRQIICFITLIGTSIAVAVPVKSMLGAFNSQICKEVEPEIPVGTATWGFYVKALEPHSSVSMRTFYNNGSSDRSPEINLEYSIDAGNTWNPFVVGETTIVLPSTGKKCFFRAGEAGNTCFARVSNGSPSYCQGANVFSFTGKVAIGGNIMSLMHHVENESDAMFMPPFATPRDYTDRRFNRLFMADWSSNKSSYSAPDSTALVDAHLLIIPNLRLTAALSYTCVYGYMFAGCKGLVVGPQLSEENLTHHIYRNMFYSCSSLAIAPELPSLKLAQGCYAGMFERCTSLTLPPELPATALQSECYNGMFRSCASLRVAPTLPSTNAAPYCYQNMFLECTSLVNSPELPAVTLATDCYRSMFSACTSLMTAPALPATNLTTRCYREMFRGCSKIDKISVGFIDPTLFESSCYYWLYGVKSTGIFECYSTLGTSETIERGVSACPANWSVVNTDSE